MIPCKHGRGPAPATSPLTGTPAFAYAQSAIFIRLELSSPPRPIYHPKEPYYPRTKGRRHPYTCLTQVYPAHLSKPARISDWTPGDGIGTTGSLFALTC